MSVAKIAISIDKKILSQLDALVKQDKFANRSQAIQIAVEAKLLELSHDRLAKECEKSVKLEHCLFCGSEKRLRVSMSTK